MRNSRTGTMMAVLFLFAGMGAEESWGQVSELKRVAASISYITPGSAYINAGSLVGLQTGDTLTISRASSVLGRIVISAISSTSSAAIVLPGAGTIAVGDSVSILKRVERKSDDASVEASTVPRTSQAQRSTTKGPQDNLASGRIALQYAGAGILGTAMDFSQPSLLLRLNIDRLFGTGLRFTMYGRESYDLSDQFSRYGVGSRANTRIYEMNVSFDDSRAPFGYSVGRIISPFLGGLGQFDGGQFYVRTGQFSVGLAAGAQADPRNSAVDFNYQKAAVFLNYSWSDAAFHSADATVAYGQQRFQGRFDRDFLYTQFSLRPSNSINFYESSEFDLHDISDGTRFSRFHLSSIFVTLGYTPLRWLTLSTGYDATRSIYLFESMKAFPDSLLNRELQQGIRAGVTVRLPFNTLLMTNGTLRPPTGGARRAYTVNSVLRMSDIAASGINAGAQYTNTYGVYTRGNDVALDVDRWFGTALVVGAKIDQYSYTISNNNEHLVATTLTFNTNIRVSQMVYFLLNFDQVWDTLRNTQRIYAEIGLRF